MLCALQPVNALVFVYDGLLYATRSFAYVRNALAVGVLALYVPAVVITMSYAPQAQRLLALWAAKALLNCWRCATSMHS